MASIVLPPTAPISFTVDLTAAQAPYFTEWYQANRLPAESPSEFLVRVLKPTVVDFVAAREIKLAHNAAKAVLANVEAEAAVIKGSL